MRQYENCVVYLLAKAYQRAHGNFKRRLQPFGLTPVQHLIMEVLWDEQGLSAGEIGKRVLLDNATLSGVLDRMAEAGWIRKEPDPGDKRVMRVYGAERAMALKTSLQAEREATNDEVLQPLRIEEKILLRRMLRDLQE